MSESDRKETRIKKNLRVKVKDGDDSYNGVITNYSKTGMSIKTNHVFPTFKAVEVMVKIKQKLVPLKGSVRWVQEGGGPADPDGDQYRHEMGIALHNPPQEYLQHFG